MKKNKMMRIASILMVAVLLTTSIISGTFAKYVTANETEDHARVAKFGVTIDAEGQLFGTNYWNVAESASNLPGADYDGSNLDEAQIIALTVESSNGDKLVAPGTKSTGNGLSLGVSGTPEVDVVITFEINDGYKDVFLKGDTYPDLTKGAYTSSNGRLSSTADPFSFNGTYYPIRYTLTGALVEKNTAELNGKFVNKGNVTLAWSGDSIIAVTGTLADIKAALEVINTYTSPADINSGKRGIYVDANQDLSLVNLGPDSLQLTWEWAFDGTVDTAKNRVMWSSGETLGYSNTMVDQMDTLLGNLAASAKVRAAEGATNVADNLISTDAYSLNVMVPITVTVTQVD